MANMTKNIFIPPIHYRKHCEKQTNNGYTTANVADRRQSLKQ